MSNNIGVRINSQPAPEINIVNLIDDYLDLEPLEENVNINMVPTKRFLKNMQIGSPYRRIANIENFDEVESKNFSIKKQEGQSNGLESPVKPNQKHPIIIEPRSAPNAEIELNKIHKKDMPTRVGYRHITENARKYYQANLPLLYRGLENDTITEDENSNLDKPIPAFDPDTAPVIPPDRMKRLHKLLHSQVEYQGKNFSQTQKKLIQVGKAILSHPNVLLLDSNFFKVEEALEQLLFELVFKNLQSSTIVTILERYEMINYFEEVLVFEKGSVIERGAPEALMSKTRGSFRNLVEIQNSHDQKIAVQRSMMMGESQIE